MPRLRPRAVLNASDLPHQKAAVPAGDAVVLSDDPAGAETATDPGQANYLGRLIAYIPAEVIAVYQAFAGPLAAGGAPYAGTQAEDGGAAGRLPGVPAEGANNGVLLWLGVALLVITPIWIYFSTRNRNEKPAIHHVVIATLAFLVWLLVASNPIVDLLPGKWQPLYGSLAMAFAAGLLFPLVEMIFRKKAAS